MNPITTAMYTTATLIEADIEAYDGTYEFAGEDARFIPEVFVAPEPRTLPTTMDTECIECPRVFTHDADLDHAYCPSCGVINHI